MAVPVVEYKCRKDLRFANRRFEVSGRNRVKRGQIQILPLEDLSFTDIAGAATCGRGTVADGSGHAIYMSFFTAIHGFGGRQVIATNWTRIYERLQEQKKKQNRSSHRLLNEIYHFLHGSVKLAN